jgi:hypothetical protein
MLVDRGQRLKGEMLRDFLEAWREPPGLNVPLQVTEDFLLAFGERHGRMSLMAEIPRESAQRDTIR